MWYKYSMSMLNGFLSNYIFLYLVYLVNLFYETDPWLWIYLPHSRLDYSHHVPARDKKDSVTKKAKLNSTEHILPSL